MRDADVTHLLDRANDKHRRQFGTAPSVADLHWIALRIRPDSRHWLRRGEVEAYVND